MTRKTPDDLRREPPWYAEVTRYQWLVLAIASAGWVFDVFEGQIFNITRQDLLADLLQVSGNDPAIKRWGDVFLAIFLAGGTLGGVLFGSLSDRWGRQPAMVITILFYSVFSGLTFFVTDLWQVAVLRFLVAMGVGGEWAVAASLVAEVFPARARAHAGGVFHASSVLGVWMAALAGMLVGTHWRYAYLIGLLPALLVLWVRIGIREPETWRQASQSQQAKLGSFRELLGRSPWRRHALLGMLLAAVGLGTYWGVVVAGQDLARDMLQREQAARSTDPTLSGAERPTGHWLRNEKLAYGLIQTSGAAIGMLAFGPICRRIGRRPTFLASFLCSMLAVPITCYLPQTYWQLLILLPFYGFFLQGLHAGYAIYFPELFPSHLRATGSGFCFNGGRLTAASILLFSGWLKSQPGVDLRLALSLLGLLFGVGIVVLLFLPETKDKPLPV